VSDPWDLIMGVRANCLSNSMTKMTLLGVPNQGGLADCTNVVPRGTNNKREMRMAPINDRIR
jgi:hypothetical protein